jgi:hypothetical protein
MTEIIKKKIKEIIQKELEGFPQLHNSHGLDVQQRLIEPYIETFEKPGEKNEFVELYVVLNEDQSGSGGYQIAYNPERNRFGLCLIGTDKHKFLLGYFKTFMEAFYGM